MDVCWLASSKRYGGPSGSPAEIEILELGPGRGLFAQDVLAWSEKKFPEFFHALHYSLAEQSPKLRDRLRGVLAGFLESGKASSVSENATEKYRPPEVETLVFGSRQGGAAEAVPSRNGTFYAVTDGRLGEVTTSSRAEQTPWMSGL